MNHKCLIYLQEKKLINAGGPLGYNYNLKCGLDNLQHNVEFLQTDAGGELTNKLKKIKNKFIRSFLKGIRDLFRYIKLFVPFGHKSSVDLNKYSLIHFHDTFDYYNIRRSLKKYKGKTILTTHSPILPSVEIGQGVEKWVRIMFFYIFLFEKHIDKYVLKRVDYIISPCENAMDSYARYWRDFNFYTQGKVLYLLTGSNRENITSMTETEVREKYSLSCSKFNICYLGRHNKVKGYDFLKKLALQINDEDIQFVIGGNLGPLYPPKSKNWKEIGFTKDALAIMKYSDVYISCNIDTYFDLATIQALSVGTIVVTRRVGGNIFFEKNSFPGVYLFDNMEELIEIVYKLKCLSAIEREKIKKLILINYEKYFNVIKFAEGYLEIINNII